MSDLLMSDSLTDILTQGSPSSLKVISPLGGDLISIGTKDGKRYYSFLTSDVLGAINLIDGKTVDSFIIMYEASQQTYVLANPDIQLECRGRKIKVTLEEPCREK